MNWFLGIMRCDLGLRPTPTTGEDETYLFKAGSSDDNGSEDEDDGYEEDEGRPRKRRSLGDGDRRGKRRRTDDQVRTLRLR